MLTTEKKTKKRNFSDMEVEVLVGEVEVRRDILFGGHSSRVTNKRKCSEGQHVAAAVNQVSIAERTVPEFMKKWSEP